MFTVSICTWFRKTVMRRGLCAMCDQSLSDVCLGDPGANYWHCVIAMLVGRCPIIVVLTQSYPCDPWFVCSTLRELAVSNLGQLLFCLSIMWSRCCTAYQILWIMTILVLWMQNSMWEGWFIPHATKFHNWSRKVVDSKAFLIYPSSMDDEVDAVW